MAPAVESLEPESLVFIGESLDDKAADPSVGGSLEEDRDGFWLMLAWLDVLHPGS